MSPDAGTNVVDVYINYLRKKLGAAGDSAEALYPVIETVRGEGYRMGSLRKHALSVKKLPTLFGRDLAGGSLIWN